MASFDRHRLPLLAQINSQPDWIIGEGGESGLDPALHGVTSVVVRGDGQIALSESSTQEVLFVDLEAGVIARAGGAGDGPEEFRGLSGIYLSDDGLVRAVDQRRMRIVDMGWGGDISGTTALPHLLGQGVGGKIVVDGSGAVYLAQLTGVLAPGAERTERPSGALVRVGAYPETLTELRGRELFSNETIMGSVIWGATTVVSPAPEGVWIGDTTESRIELWSGSDGLSAIVHWLDDSDRTIADADVEAFIERLRDVAEPHEREQLRIMADMLPFAAERPHFGPIVAGLDGSVWIGPPRDPAFEVLEGRIEDLEPATEWMVVDPWDGTAGRVVTPAGFQLGVVGSGYVIGIHRDTLGRESVRRYPMTRARTLETHEPDGEAR